MSYETNLKLLRTGQVSFHDDECDACGDHATVTDALLLWTVAGQSRWESGLACEGCALDHASAIQLLPDSFPDPIIR